MKIDKKLHLLLWDKDPFLKVSGSAIVLTFEEDEDMEYIDGVFDEAIMTNPKENRNWFSKLWDKLNVHPESEAQDGNNSN